MEVLAYVQLNIMPSALQPINDFI